MEAGELQNANPTILSVAELPTRKQRRSTRRNRGPEHKYDDILSMKNSGVPWGTSPDGSPWPSDEDEVDEFTEAPIDEQEIYVTCLNFTHLCTATHLGSDRHRQLTLQPLDLIATISDPEHPYTLAQLSVVNLPDIHIFPPPSEGADPNALRQVVIDVTPTINHCSLVTVIGLAVRVRLERTLPPNFRIDVRVKEGSHTTSEGVSKQLGDKERVAAALENDTLRGVVDKMLETCG